MIIDVHAHLHDEKFDNVREDILNNLSADNVEKVINAGCDYETCEKALNLCNKYDNCFAVLGMHPEYCEKYNQQFEEYLINACKHEKVVGIGEIGLDYFWTKENKELQKQVFISQIKIAHKLSLPIVVHIRDAYGDALEIFKEYKNYLTNGVCLHCFSGSEEFYQEINKMGFYVSIGGTVTFKNNVKTVEVVKNLNKQKFMLETDCPYLAPVPHRGELNEPKYIYHTACKFADVWKISPQDVIDLATKNSYEFFKRLGNWYEFKRRT